MDIGFTESALKIGWGVGITVQFAVARSDSSNIVAAYNILKPIIEDKLHYQIDPEITKLNL